MAKKTMVTKAMETKKTSKKKSASAASAKTVAPVTTIVGYVPVIDKALVADGSAARPFAKNKPCVKAAQKAITAGAIVAQITDGNETPAFFCKDRFDFVKQAEVQNYINRLQKTLNNAAGTSSSDPSVRVSSPYIVTAAAKMTKGVWYYRVYIIQDIHNSDNVCVYNNQKALLAAIAMYQLVNNKIDILRIAGVNKVDYKLVPFGKRITPTEGGYDYFVKGSKLPANIKADFKAAEDEFLKDVSKSWRLRFQYEEDITP